MGKTHPKCWGIIHRFRAQDTTVQSLAHLQILRAIRGFLKTNTKATRDFAYKILQMDF